MTRHVFADPSPDVGRAGANAPCRPQRGHRPASAIQAPPPDSSRCSSNWCNQHSRAAVTEGFQRRDSPPPPTRSCRGCSSLSSASTNSRTFCRAGTRPISWHWSKLWLVSWQPSRASGGRSRRRGNTFSATAHASSHELSGRQPSAWRQFSRGSCSYRVGFGGTQQLSSGCWRRSTRRASSTLSPASSERRQVGPEVGPTSAFYSCIPPECMGQLASFGPT